MLSEVIATSDGRVKRYTSYLRLYDIEDSAAGKYQCVVSNDLSKVFSQRAFVRVYGEFVFLVEKSFNLSPILMMCMECGISKSWFYFDDRNLMV